MGTTLRSHKLQPFFSFLGRVERKNSGLSETRMATLGGKDPRVSTTALEQELVRAFITRRVVNLVCHTTKHNEFHGKRDECDYSLIASC